MNASLSAKRGFLDKSWACLDEAAVGYKEIRVKHEKAFEYDSFETRKAKLDLSLTWSIVSQFDTSDRKKFESCWPTSSQIP